MIGDEILFINGGGDAQLTLYANVIIDMLQGEYDYPQLTLDGNVIEDILQDEYDYVTLGDQILILIEKGITEMGLDTMPSTSVLIPRVLTMGGIFHRVVQ